MGRYPGAVTCDLSGQLLPELKPVLALDLSATEAAGLDADGILNNATTSATVVTVITTLPTQPPQARGLTFAPSGSALGNIIVAGTDIDNRPITETIATSTTNAVTSLNAYKTVTSVSLPISAETITWDVGWDNRLGLPFMLAEKPFYFEIFDNAIEIATAGALVVDADELGKNTYDPQGSLDGEKPLRLLLFI